MGGGGGTYAKCKGQGIDLRIKKAGVGSLKKKGRGLISAP